MPRSVSLADLVDLAQQLRRDVDADPTQLRLRDREIGKAVGELRGRRREQVLAWLERMRDREPGLAGGKVVLAQKVLWLLLGLLGLALGSSAAAALLRYDGQAPINVVYILAAFVGVQLVLLVLVALTMLPTRLLRLIPCAGDTQELVMLLSPGRLTALLARLLPLSWRQGLTFQRQYGGVQRWGIIASAQILAVCFNVGAVVTAMTLVTFEDLAFVWSTTLQVDAAMLQRLTDLMSAPFAWLWPQARPSMELLETTRYYRAARELTPPGVSPMALGGWWPFVVACMITYGLLPRLVTLAAAMWQYRRSLQRAFLLVPGILALEDRLNHYVVETRATGPEVEKPAVADPVAALDALPVRAARLVNWGDVGVGDAEAIQLAARRFAVAEDPVLHAGGAADVAGDAAVLRVLAEGDPEAARVVLVRSWEPPMLELMDFLGELRQELGPGTPLVVAPVALTPAGRPADPDPRDLAQWQAAIQDQADPWLTLLTLAAPEKHHG